MRFSQGSFTLTLFLFSYFYAISAFGGHGKDWKKHESNWKKGGLSHSGGEQGGKYRDDDWDKSGKHGSRDNYDKGGNEFEKYGKYRGGRDDFGKYTSGVEGHDSWGGQSKQGGKSRQENVQDTGRNNKGFKNSYQKSENGDQTSYHDVSDHGSIQNDVIGRDHWNKYGGDKFYKDIDGSDRFDGSEQGGMLKNFGNSGRDNHNGGDYDRGGDHHHRNWGLQDNGGKHYSDHEDIGRRGHSSGHGGYGGHGGFHH